MNFYLPASSVHDLLQTLGFHGVPQPGTHDLVFTNATGRAMAINSNPTFLLSDGFITAIRLHLTNWGCVTPTAFDQWAQAAQWVGPIPTKV